MHSSKDPLIKISDMTAEGIRCRKQMETTLKNIVDQHLKERGRSFTWLAGEMGRTYYGLRLGLINGSIKYNDIIRLLHLLDIKPNMFFGLEEGATDSSSKNSKALYNDCMELLSVLKFQLLDKDKIIALMKSG